MNKSNLFIALFIDVCIFMLLSLWLLDSFEFSEKVNAIGLIVVAMAGLKLLSIGSDLINDPSPLYRLVRRIRSIDRETLTDHLCGIILVSLVPLIFLSV